MNLLVTILTSNNLELLKTTYYSVKNQKNTNIKFDIFIIVNTLNPDYFLKVKNEFPNTVIIQTESNGRPGKGHNSLFEIFKKHDKYDYMWPLDGDDILYPYCFKRLEIYLNYKPDILLLPFSDKLTIQFPENSLHYCLSNKCYLQFNNYVKNMRNQWNNDKKSPFDNNINLTNTAGRLILCSRKALNINLQYSEELKWFDDMLLFLQIFEQFTISREYNIYIIDDRDMYIYNCLNDNSVTEQFKKDNKNKQIQEDYIFRKSIYNKFLSIRNWDLTKFVFLKADKINEFKLKDKIIFCENIISMLKLPNIKINKKSYELFIRYAEYNNFTELKNIFLI